MNVNIITVGDEILIGQVIDTNSAWIGQQLNKAGFKIHKIISVKDQEDAIIEGVEDAFRSADIVLATGGLGPTKDDITKKTLAKYFDREMVFDDATYQHISQYFERLGRKPVEAHRLQSYMPQGISIYPNKMGTAPAMLFKQKNKILVSMPGVPYEMKAFITQDIIPYLQEHYQTDTVRHQTIVTSGKGESDLAKILEDFEANLPRGFSLAYLPRLGVVRLRLSAVAQEDYLFESLTEKLKNQLPPHLIVGENDISLEEALGKMLQEKGYTMGTAESCTGGLLAHRITSNPGASAYYKGSVIAYSNELKINQLGVNPSTLEEYGAVSEATVREMVQGTLKHLNTDYAIATSGIAGPTGGTPIKPVGTIWVAVGNKDTIKTKKLQLGNNRRNNIDFTSTIALNMLRLLLIPRKKA